MLTLVYWPRYLTTFSCEIASGSALRAINRRFSYLNASLTPEQDIPVARRDPTVPLDHFDLRMLRDKGSERFLDPGEPWDSKVIADEYALLAVDQGPVRSQVRCHSGKGV
eukprot:4994163-Prymnesium_polylepis.2